MIYKELLKKYNAEDITEDADQFTPELVEKILKVVEKLGGQALEIDTGGSWVTVICAKELSAEARRELQNHYLHETEDEDE